MANYSYNGTVLPELPAYDTLTYQYAFIVRALDDATKYDLYVVDRPIYVDNINGVATYCIYEDTTCNFYSANTEAIDSGWETKQIGYRYTTIAYITSGFEMVWSSTDITYSDGTVYFNGSTPTDASGGESEEPPVTAPTDLQPLSYILGWLAGRRVRKSHSDVIKGRLHGGMFEFDTDTLTLTLNESDEEFSGYPYVLRNDTITIDTYDKPAPNYVVDSDLPNAYLYNGIRLPALPDGLTDYPYMCILAKNSNDDTSVNTLNRYNVYYSANPIYIGDTIDTCDNIYITNPCGRLSYQTNADAIWDRNTTYDYAQVVPLIGYRYLLWSNHDTKRGENVVLAGSEPVPAST